MSVFDKITDKELKMIRYYISAFGGKSSDEVEITAPIEDILYHWNCSKELFLSKIFKDSLIIEKDVVFEKSEEEIIEDIQDDLIGFRAKNEYKEFVDEWFDLTARFFEREKISRGAIYNALSYLMTNDSLASNRYSGPSVDIPLPDEKVYRLSTGCKTSKAIGKIASAYNLKGYEAFRIRHSQILNEKSISGTLCVSIHPLDYMTMSDNDCGWSSCMSWMDKGDFRQGTVEMLNSPSVVVVYLKSSTDFNINSLEEYSWNSKRWRELFIVDNSFIAGIKGYPYWNRDLENVAINWLTELATEAGIGIYEKNILDYDAEEKEVILPNDFISLRFISHMMYNDFYSSHRIRIAEDHALIPSEYTYSGASECMCCGSIHNEFETESDILCYNCDDSQPCSECGTYYSREDMIEVDGFYYCPDCFESIFVRCPGCEEMVREDDLHAVYIGVDKNHVSKKYYLMVCYDCLNYESNLYEGSTHTLKTGPYGWERVHYVHPEDLTDEGWNELGFITSIEEYLEVEDNIYFKAYEPEDLTF